MPSILPDFEYDIFISYRQNDNKRDGWVTNFVEALRGELEATLKNKVSIYFDENPTDGLLETHQVGATLDGKLKCIVFLPIISQTYCDENGYAWSQEFLPFLERAKADSLGMDIKLANGNIVSRVLPVKIHDLDSEDQSLIESKLGGPIRSIDFIYREPGVNRSLTPDDNKADNLQGTNYKNQVNKVANALKEIGQATLKDEKVVETRTKITTPTHAPPTKSKNKSIAIISFVLVSLISLIIYSFWGTGAKEVKDKSIAVLPFTKVNSGEQIEALAFGIHDDLLTKLSKFNELQVTSRTSVMEYENTRKKISEIADELSVGYILEGSIQQSNNRFRLNIQLIDGNTDDHLWAEIFDLELTPDNIFQIQSEIASNIASQMQMNLADSKVTIEAGPPTNSIAALRLYNQGALLMQAKPIESIDRLKEALTIDQDFHKARVTLIRALSLYYKSIPDSISLKEQAFEELNILKAECDDPHLKLMAQAYYDYYALGDFRLTKENLLKGDQSNLEVVEAQAFIARRLDDWETYFEFAENINLKKDPRNSSSLQDLSFSLAMTHERERVLEYIDRAIEYSHEAVYKDLKFNFLLSNLAKQEEAERFYNAEKPNLNLTQNAIWKYWLDYYKRDFNSIIEPDYMVPKGLVLSNGDYSNLMQLPSDLFLAQAYWLMGDKARAKKEVELHGQQFLDFHDHANCPIGPAGDFYGNEATAHISRGYALVFSNEPEKAIMEAEHAMSIYPYTKDGIQGRVVQDLAFRLIALAGDADKTVKMADQLLGSKSWISIEMIKNDPIYDQYRELEEYKRIVAKYE